MRALAKYLSDYAEPETVAAESITSRYARALVVPAFREDASLLDGYLAAARAAPGATLCVLVVNGPDDAPEAEHLENGRFLSSILERLERAPEAGSRLPNIRLGTVAPSKLDVLVIDRASPGLRVPRKEGVGLARKIGADMALALHAQGKIASPLLFFTDADATLPEDHFLQSKLEGARGPSAVVFPFWHVPSGDAAVDEATALYELSLRYYVRGLRFAGSPYAFHTLGSATAVFAESYAAVRGVPKRSAAEDFYLLSKLAKVGPVAGAASSPILIRSRRSNRTPFGTGASVDGFLACEHAFYDPRCFVVLRATLGVVAAFAEHGIVSRLEGCLPASIRSRGPSCEACSTSSGFDRLSRGWPRKSKSPRGGFSAPTRRSMRSGP